MVKLPDIDAYELALTQARSGLPLTASEQQAFVKTMENMLIEAKALRTLQNPEDLHINLLRGFPCKLSHRQMLHLIGAGECSNQGCCIRKRDTEGTPAG
jgi:hypothetical protein